MAMVRAPGTADAELEPNGAGPGGRVPGHVGGVLGAAKAAARLRSVAIPWRHEQETVTGQCSVAAGR
jgi:hypothetical protein